MTIDELRAEMLSILGNGANWCKGSNARKADNTPCPIGNPSAAQWDIYGALWLANYNLDAPDWSTFHELYERMSNNLPHTYKNKDIESYNDDVEWAELLPIINN